ncbi:MAG TPA: hypothetical protein VGG58_07305 [Candidatus Acidoferrum sp.]
MLIVISPKFSSTATLRLRRAASSLAPIAVAALFSALPLAAQLPTLDVSKTASQTPSAPKTESSDTPPTVSTKPPDIPVDQVIKKFGDRELEFKKERDNYTYTQTFVVQTIDFDGRPDGEYRMTSDILFTPEGKRYEKVVSAPPPTLQRISLSQQDLDDLEHVQPFVLTSDELPKYDVTYVGRESLDELGTYVFDVKPKKIEKNQRYFQGRIWVDDRDLNIVKSDGKAVPDIIKKGQENIFPRFETFRENIEGHYWFPTYTRSDDELHFSTGAVHMRMTVRYANYKRFGAIIKIGPAVETKDQPDPNKDKPKP